MKILETADTLELTDERVWVAGDWHGNISWVRRLFRTMSRVDEGIETVLQLGDFWPHGAMIPELDRRAHQAGIKRVLFVPGNHEPWQQLSQLEEGLAPGQAVRISEVVWFLPRPFRFTIAGLRVLALGGASSVDAAWRTQGVDWWPEERINDVHEALAIATGPAEIMLTHESPMSSVPEVQQILDSNPGEFPAAERAISQGQRERVERIWDEVSPRVLLHGHMHVYGERTLDDGRRVISLASDETAGHAGVLNMRTLAFDLLDQASIH